MKVRIGHFLPILFFALYACTEKPKADPDALRPQVEAFAHKVSEEMNEGRIAALDKHFDKKVFVDKVTTDRYWDEYLKEIGDTMYKYEFRNRLLREMTLAGMFLSGIDGKQFFTYDVAKVYRLEDRWHAIFRIFANDAINYHDCLLRVDTNKVWIEDIYVMTVGAQLSQIMQEPYIAGINAKPNDALFVDHAYLRKAKLLAQQGDFNEAIAVFDSISASFKASKSLRLFRLQISANIPNEDYVRQLEAYEKDFPKDAGTLLLRLDKNFLYGNFPAVLEDIALLEKMYNPDPILSYYCGNAQFGLDNCQEAGVAYKTTLNAKPTWEEPFVNWLRCLVRNNQYQKSINLIENYQEAFGLTPTYVKYMVSDYPNFANSSTFRAWQDKVSSVPIKNETSSIPPR